MILIDYHFRRFQVHPVVQVRRVLLVFQETPEFQDRMDDPEHLDPQVSVTPTHVYNSFIALLFALFINIIQFYILLKVPKETLVILEAQVPPVPPERREPWVKWDSLVSIEYWQCLFAQQKKGIDNAYHQY